MGASASGDPLGTMATPRFAVQAAKWVYEWMIQGQPSIKAFERLIRMYLAKGRAEEWFRERIEGILTRTRPPLSSWR